MIRYSVAACQTDFANPVDRRGMRANTDRILSMIDSAVAGAARCVPERCRAAAGVLAFFRAGYAECGDPENLAVCL